MEEPQPPVARLVAPPRARMARLVRPPRKGALHLIGTGLAIASSLRLPWLLLACARLLRSAAWAAPPIVLLGAFRHALAASGDPFRAIAETVRDPAVLLPAFGLAGAALLASALIEITGWAIGLPAIAASLESRQRLRAAPHDAAAGIEGAAGYETAATPDMAARSHAKYGAAAGPRFAARFASLVQIAALLLLIACIWAAAILPLLSFAGRLWLDAHAAGGSGAALASAALALIVTTALFGTLALRLVAEAAVARVGTSGETPLVAIYEAGALVLRRPMVFVSAIYLLGIGGVFAALAFGIPGALAPAGAPGFAMKILVKGATAVALGFLALARLGVFVAAASEQSES